MTLSQSNTGFYQETFRPQFHFTARQGWLNDPNGLVYYDGEYHLFYQHNPVGPTYGPMHWGHAVSSDLVHWQELPIALFPQEDKYMAFSGSAVVDAENTSGFKTGDNDVIVLIYTRTGKGQSLAYSNDRGRTWCEYEQNPMLPDSLEHQIDDYDRDPKVCWHQPSGDWIMVLYENKGFTFYSSPNLKNWKKLSRIEGYYECPDFFELPVDGNNLHRKWVLMGGDGQYQLGDFNGREFTPETKKISSCTGYFYAAQTWSNIPTDDGRRIQIAWAWGNGGSYPDMPFSQQMVFPCELALRTFPEGIRLCNMPVREIELLYDAEQYWEKILLTPEKDLLIDVKSDLLHFIFDIDVADAQEVNFSLRGVKIRYSVKDAQLSVGETVLGLPLRNNCIQGNILLDRTSLELYADRGRVSVVNCFLPDANQQDISLFAMGGAANIEKLHVFSLHPSW